MVLIPQLLKIYLPTELATKMIKR